MDIKGLYVITDENESYSHIDIAKKALKAGARIIQYREKHKSIDDKAIDCSAIKKLCQKNDAILIINDYSYLAAAVEADGVHIGQDDGSIEDAKKRIPDKIVGVSVSTVEEAIEAEKNGAHYLRVGPVFLTPLKDEVVPPIGLANLKVICDNTSLPVIAIGGINTNNAGEVYKAGASGIAFIPSAKSSKDIIKTTKELLEISEPFTSN